MRSVLGRWNGYRGAERPAGRRRLYAVGMLLAAICTGTVHQTVAESFWDKIHEVTRELDRTIKEALPPESSTRAPDAEPVPLPPRFEPPRAPSYSPLEVRETQRLLNALGYDAGPVDGQFGQRTRSAILAFEADQGLAPTGAPTRDLVDRLRHAQQSPAAVHRQAGFPQQAQPPAMPPGTAGGSRSRPSWASPDPGAVGGQAASGEVGRGTALAPALPQPRPEQRAPMAAGEDMVEIRLPAGLRPVRLPGIDGLPLLQDPMLTMRGKTDRKALAEEWDRLVELLRLAHQPRLLQGIEYTEKFAVNNLDETTKAHFFPGRRVVFQGGTFGTNEFDRKERFAEFLRRFEQPLRESIPGLPFEFVYVRQMLLGTYDEQQARFPLSTTAGEAAGSMRLVSDSRGLSDLSVNVPTHLSIDRDAARELLRRLPDKRGMQLAYVSPIRHVYLQARIAITGWTSGRYGQLFPTLALHSTELFEDQDLARRIRAFEPPAEAPAPAPVMVEAVPFWTHLPPLYAMRDLAGFLDDASVVASTRYLLNHESGRWRNVSNKGANTCGGKQTVFEWPKVRDELARGALIDVMLNPEADWSFLDRETRYGLVQDHCVELFVFPYERIEGRQLEFVAHELAPTYRKTLEAAIARLPERVYLSKRLPAARYDHQARQLVFDDAAGGRSSAASPAQLLQVPSRDVEFLAPGESTRDRSQSRHLRAPKALEGLAFYQLVSELQRDEGRVRGRGLRPRPLSSGVQGNDWRSSVALFRNVGDGQRDYRTPQYLALDRQLEQRPLAMEPAAAERLLAAQSRSGDQSMQAMIVLDIERVETVSPGYPGIVRARLDHVLITTTDGLQVARLEASAFPDAQARHRAAQAAAQQQQTAAAAADAEQARRDAADRARLDALLQGHTGDVLVQRAGAGRIGKVYTTGGSALIGYRHAVAANGLDLPAAGALSTRKMATTLRDDATTALVVHAGVFARDIYPQVKDLELVVSPFPPKVAEVVIEDERASSPDGLFGPDVVGLRLGMSFDAADRVIRAHMPIGRVLEADRAWQAKAAAGTIRPYTSGRLYESADGNERIVLFDEPPAAPKTVLGLVRLVNFPKGSVPPAAVYAGLEKKYGRATLADPSGDGQIWYENAQAERGYSCSPSHNAADTQNIWRDPNPAPQPTAIDPRQPPRHQYQYTPVLDCLSCDDGERVAKCATGLSAVFETRGSNEHDRLVIRVYNQRAYAAELAKSIGMVKRGEGRLAPGAAFDLAL